MATPHTGWKGRLDEFLQQFHVRVEDVVPDKERGYWIALTECGGLDGGCSYPMHVWPGEEAPVLHRFKYLDESRDGGKFASPYRTWRKARAEYRRRTDPQLDLFPMTDVRHDEHHHESAPHILEDIPQNGEREIETYNL